MAYSLTFVERSGFDGIRSGDLVLKMGEGEIRWHKPVVYQEKDGARQRSRRNMPSGLRTGWDLSWRSTTQADRCTSTRWCTPPIWGERV